MVPSLVTRLPTGSEKGRCIALDMGGTNVRAILIELDGHGDVRTVATVKKQVRPFAFPIRPSSAHMRLK